MTRYADAQLNAIKKAMLQVGEARKWPASSVLTHYAVERFLQRLGEVETGKKREIVLRGAVLLSFWHPDDARPSTTVDLLTRRIMDDAALAAWLQSICAVQDPDDGLSFQADSIVVADRRSPGGYRTRHATLGVMFGRQRAELCVSVGYQKDLLPHPGEQTLATLLEVPMAPPKVYVCAKESVMAEKLHMVHVAGRHPSYKDFFDLYLMTALHAFAGGPVMAAIKNTFDQNISSIADHLPHALSLKGADDAVLKAGWGAFVRQSGSPLYAKPWPDTLHRLHSFFAPPWKQLCRQKPFASTWQAAHGWQ